MAYRIEIKRTAQKDLLSLNQDIKSRIIEIIKSLAQKPKPIGSIKLKGSKNQFRFRSGDYRILYEVYEKERLIIIFRIKHRKDSYKK